MRPSVYAGLGGYPALGAPSNWGNREVALAFVWQLSSGRPEQQLGKFEGGGAAYWLAYVEPVSLTSGGWPDYTLDEGGGLR